MRTMIDQPFGPAVPSVPLERSPLTFVVVQVRFPLVASISDQKFIGPFQERIRKTYPDLRQEMETQVVVGPDGANVVQGGAIWKFTNDPGSWEVALAPEFLALATKTYTSRADFLARLGVLVEALGDWLDLRKVRRLGVRYIDRIQGTDPLARLGALVRPEVVGPTLVTRPSEVALNHTLTDCGYKFADDSELRARWGRLEPKSTFDPAVEPVDDFSWVLDLDAWHGERDFEAASIRDQVQLFSDRIYRYFRWAVTEEFLSEFGAAS